ncbi:MFS transporter [Thioclava indica]|uniref:Major facilitator superfamily (MFS) profile domain-containing protein n=1 Tax=Thioclava indica TaxID=1353528 RepID=A0A074JIR8_9RHOB|nr:MFS transporter [Thioclava indica]KEO57511.1 hypothetical protein DT23_05425 [Thioclava indica]
MSEMTRISPPSPDPELRARAAVPVLPVLPDAAQIEPAASEPTQPAQPSAEAPVPLGKATLYMAAASIIALSQSISMGFVSANIPQLAGDIHATTLQATWVMAAFYAPRASMPLMLIKIRNQFGLRPFAELGILAFVFASILNLYVDDLHSAVVVSFISGCAAAPLSSLAFLYMMEHVPQKYRLSLSLSGALTMIMLGRSLARVLLPTLTNSFGWVGVSEMQLGMAMLSLALVYLLPLTPRPLEKVLAPLDFVSFFLLAAGFGGVTVSFLFGPYDYWTQTPWLGALLAVAVACIATAVAIELNRKDPLIDMAWVLSPPILHLSATLLIFRIALSEQTAGVVGMFRALGLVPAQEQMLFAIITGSMLLGGVVCAIWNKAERAPLFHAIALILIASGAWMDSSSTILTRPEQMYVSQAMIGFASLLFLPPAMAQGLMAAFAKGPNYLLSFVIVFLATQSLGGIIGSGLFRSLLVRFSALHSADLSAQIAPGNAQLSGTLNALAAQYGTTITDSAMRSAGAISQVASSVSLQATVLAYDDMFRLIAWLSIAALAALLLHLGWRRGYARWGAPARTA